MKNNTSHIKSFIIGLILISSNLFFAQNSLKIGDNLYKQEKYCEAIKYYNKYLNKYVNEKVFLKRGIANYQCQKFKSAINDFENCVIMGSDDERINYYLAKTYHNQQKFDKAIIYYKKYLKDIGKNKNKRKEIVREIKRCAHAIDLKYKPTTHFIENWGPKINTQYNDISPLQSPTNNHHFYFASDRVYGLKKKARYNEFQVDFSEGDWEKLYDIYSTNQNRNTVFLDFQNNGSKIIYFAGHNIKRGSIFTSNYSHSKKQLETENSLEAPIHAENGFNYIQYVNDSTIIFSSNRDGGYGGYDLYFTGFRNGSWFKPVNLGPNINSSYDEISPFLTKSGEYLYFSSNNLNSVGGFDIFKSKFSYNDDDWDIPQNLGMPINSPGNESGFRILSSGKGGIYNSDRKDKGFGGYDLYWIYFKKIVDVNRAYVNEIPFLRNRHLKLINPPVTENTEVAVNTQQDNTPSEKEVKKKVENKTVKGKVIVEDNKKDKKPKESIKKPKKEPKVVVVNKKKVKNNTKTKPSKKAKNQRNSKKLLVKKSNTNKKKFIVPLLFIKDKKFRDNTTSIEFIDKLARLMKKYPQIKVEFVGNSFSWENAQSELLNSVRIAEPLIDSLTLRMVDPSRIIVKGVGSSLPAAKPYGPKRSKNIIIKANNRIDVFIHNTKDLPISVKNENLYISRSIEDARYKLYKTIIEGLTYKVQVKTGDFLFLDKLLDKYNDSSIEKDIINNKYYYTIGLYSDYASAKDLYSMIIKEGRSNLKIIPYIDGVRINKKEALIKAKKYIDLVNYLEDNKN